MNLILCIIISCLAFTYSILYLIKARNIKITCKSNSKIVVFIFYILFTILILIKEFSKTTIITSFIIVISAVIYSLIPSGFDEKGIYISGRFFAFNKIKDISLDYVNGYYQLSFSYKGKYHMLIGDKNDKAKLNECKLMCERNNNNIY